MRRRVNKARTESHAEVIFEAHHTILGRLTRFFFFTHQNGASHLHFFREPGEVFRKVDKHFFKEAVLAGNEPSWEVGAISSNLSEFRELNVYYLCLVYLIILVFYRSLTQEKGKDIIKP